MSPQSMRRPLIEWSRVCGTKLPTLFAVGIEVVSKKIKEHPYWRFGVLVFGVGLSVLTWFHMSRATRQANSDREKAIIETSERVSAKVSESVRSQFRRVSPNPLVLNTLKQSITCKPR